MSVSEAQSQLIDLADLEGRIEELRARYAMATPFPHIVLDDVVPGTVIEQIYAELDEMPNDRWNGYLHFNERKYSNIETDTWGPTLRAVADELLGDRFTKWLSDLTGFDDLRPDASLDGGGLHRSYRNGFLNVHADFTAHHTVRNWRRRINLLFYLNREWQPEWQGDLELWSADMSRCETTVAPTGNRILLFTTDEHSFHGHPEPLRSPDDVARQSLALYYFTEEEAPIARATDYRARPDDGARRVGIYLDKQALAVYDRVKRRFKLSDAAVQRILRPFGRRD
ncbi:MAG: 2OG-Fe(II) oxygenase [Ilumatobacter sp.]